ACLTARLLPSENFLRVWDQARLILLQTDGLLGCAQDIGHMNHLCASCRRQKASKVDGLAAQHGYRAVLC
ncbi:MAG: hypothetical protein P8N63_09300, partial [Pseudomonadales bacterium]|nr:hypothetical protein [Pseudomonadales bacterium]